MTSEGTWGPTLGLQGALPGLPKMIHDRLVEPQEHLILCRLSQGGVKMRIGLDTGLPIGDLLGLFRQDDLEVRDLLSGSPLGG